MGGWAYHYIYIRDGCFPEDGRWPRSSDLYHGEEVWLCATKNWRVGSLNVDSHSGVWAEWYPRGQFTWCPNTLSAQNTWGAWVAVPEDPTVKEVASDVAAMAV